VCSWGGRRRRRWALHFPPSATRIPHMSSAAARTGHCPAHLHSDCLIIFKAAAWYERFFILLLFQKIAEAPWHYYWTANLRKVRFCVHIMHILLQKYVFTFILCIFCIFDIFFILTGQRSCGPPCHWARLNGQPVTKLLHGCCSGLQPVNCEKTLKLLFRSNSMCSVLYAHSAA
jgi:hypothetical protein